MAANTKSSGTESGLTLVELMVSIAILALIVGALFQVTAGALDSWGHGREKVELLHEVQFAMEKMVSSVRATTWVLLPLKISDPSDPGYPGSSYYPRDILAVSGNIDNDGDGRIDEDPGADITGDSATGIKGFDDDGDGLVDETWGGTGNDDESGTYDEDKVDGIDNDGDGRIDEDPGNRWNCVANDDDNDGRINEDPLDPLIFHLSGTTLKMRQNIQSAVGADQVLAENVTQFRVLQRRVNGNTLIDITLRLETGVEAIELSTTAFAANMLRPSDDCSGGSDD